MIYTTFNLVTYINQTTPIPKEFHINTLNKMTEKDWRVVTSLYTVGNTSILLLEKNK